MTLGAKKPNYLMKPSLVATMKRISRNLNPRERVGVAQFGSLLLHRSPQQHQHLGEADYDGTELFWNNYLPHQTAKYTSLFYPVNTLLSHLGLEPISPGSVKASNSTHLKIALNPYYL